MHKNKPTGFNLATNCSFFTYFSVSKSFNNQTSLSLCNTHNYQNLEEEHQCVFVLRFLQSIFKIKLFLFLSMLSVHERIPFFNVWVAPQIKEGRHGTPSGRQEDGGCYSPLPQDQHDGGGGYSPGNYLNWGWAWNSSTKRNWTNNNSIEVGNQVRSMEVSNNTL